MLVEQRLEDMNIVLPRSPRLHPGGRSDYQWAVVHGKKAGVSGHEPLGSAGTSAGQVGRVPVEVPLERTQASARLATVDILVSLKSVLGDLDRVTGWVAVVAFVNADPSYHEIDLVMSPVSELILALYGPEVGAHERRAVAVSASPLNLPVTLVAEIEISN